jgi:hypothetical protein
MIMTKFRRLKHRYRFPVSVCLDREGNVLIRSASTESLPTRRLRADEDCRRFVEDFLGTKIGARPALVTFREACKLYGLAWLLADLVPGNPMWARVLARFAKRSGRAASLWEHTTTGFDCAETARLFRALVFEERHRATSPNRIVIDHPDIDVLRKATTWDPGRAYMRRHFRLQIQRQYRILANSTSSALPFVGRPVRPEKGQWAGVICPKPATLLLMPVDHLRRPKSGYHAIVTNIQDLRTPDQGQGKRTHAAQALESLVERIEAADPSASAHSLIAMQGPLLIAAEELRARSR